MSVVWSPESRRNRLEIWAYVSKENPRAAVDLDELFDRKADALELFPRRGRPGVIPGTRELLVHEHYKLVYELDLDDIIVLAIVHTSRLWPPQANA